MFNQRPIPISSNLSPAGMAPFPNSNIGNRETAAKKSSSMIIIPSLNNEIISATLEINKNLIAILVELQNSGWIHEGVV